VGGGALDHAEAGGPVRYRAHAPLALAFVAVVVAAAAVASEVGRAAPGPAPEPTVASSRWICPHGGNDGWTGSVVLMNPGPTDVDVRISTLGRTRKVVTTDATVPASQQLVHDVPVTDRGAATVVDAFGGWVGVAWLVASEDPAGLGAEPCVAGGGRRWFAGDPGTPQGDDAFLVVTNPYDIEAIVDVALYSADRPPIRPQAWTDLEIGPRRSIALPVNPAAEGEEALLADVAAQVGRVAVASYVTPKAGGIRSAIASPSTSDATLELPVSGGAGPTTLSIGVPTEAEARFDATLLTREPPQAAGGLSDGEQAGPTARAYPVPTGGPSSVHVRVDASSGLVAALRAEGLAADPGATAGSSTTASAWVVPSTVLGDPSFPAVVLVNPGSRNASVGLSRLSGGDGVAGDAEEEERVAVPAGAAVAVPAAFLRVAPDAAILARSEGGEIVALGASSSLGIEGYARYALVLGVPLPADA
jgi:hypothetical protein